MKTIVFLLVIISTQLNAQTDSSYKHISLQCQGTYYRAQDFTSPQYEPAYNTFGISPRFSIGVFQSGILKMDLFLGYHYINKYGQYNGSEFSSDKLLEYHGGYTGFGLKFGNHHHLETNFLIGGGAYVNWNPKVLSGSMETSAEIGYQFISNKRVLFRTGGTLNLGRNGFWSPMYGAYAGIGYVFKDNSGKIKTSNTTKLPMSFALSMNGYLYSLLEEVAGIGVRFDHYLYNSDAVSLGYSIEFRRGISFEDLIHSASSSFSMLIGERHKFELNLGPNFPILNDGYGYSMSEYYEFIYFGIGYRYSPPDKRVIIRVSSATTGVLNFGFGLKLGKL